MGRAMDWLVAQRPAMVEILAEMERGYAREVGGGQRGDLTFMLNSLSLIAAGMAGKPRSLAAMRQAWWRWTTDGQQAGTPPVRDLALIVRHALNHGWLQGLKRASCRALVDRLMRELEDIKTAERRPLEVAWSPTARTAVNGLVDFLEARIAKRASEEGDGYWGTALPASLVVQAEVRVMLQEVIEGVVRSLGAPRDVFAAAEDSDTFVQPFEGWPQALRSMAAMAADILNEAANEYEETEAALIPAPDDHAPRRTKFFGSASKGRSKE